MEHCVAAKELGRQVIALFWRIESSLALKSDSAKNQAGAGLFSGSQSSVVASQHPSLNRFKQRLPTFFDDYLFLTGSHLMMMGRQRLVHSSIKAIFRCSTKLTTFISFWQPVRFAPSPPNQAICYSRRND